MGQGDDEALLRANLAFYEPLWRQSRLLSPDCFNTWPLVQSLARSADARLEVAPGLRPRLPLQGTSFLDASPAAVAKLRSSGARAEHGVVSKLPFADGAFGLVAAFDVVEHVDDDDAALAEIARVASLGATVLLSVPLYAARWTKFDELVGHRRRYEPGDLVAKLARHGLAVSGTAAYGMQPRSPFVVWIGIFWLTYLRTFAIWWYDRIIVHFGARFQTALALTPGMMDVAEVDELLVACKKTAREDA